jgi:SpoVK/Ycf46/Vps4 family AAA+-type ATPase
MVEISKIQSKWVGESEKNLSRVFDEYRRCRKAYSLDPILLFNEADAILGKRTSVKSSVDKSYNAIQNILLQELEDFEGIFMATTNLADQLDAAFDRRFLYKVSFSQPELHVRKKILEQVFPGCQPGVLENLVNQYPLTGGQIMNVKKKLTIQLLLQPILNKEEVLHQLVKEELTLSAPPSKTIIGFLKPE